MSAPAPKKLAPELETLSVLALFFLVLNLLTQRQLFVYAGVAMLFVALFVKPLARVISRVWLRFAELLGVFNSKLILSLAFFLFLTPLALMYRAFHKNPLNLKPDPNAETFFVTREHLYSKTDFEKMW